VVRTRRPARHAKIMGMMGSREAILSFDFEASLGMPFHEPYDIRQGSDLLLQHLSDADVRAVFFVVARLVETHPEVVKEIAGAGHVIGFHGYMHESLCNISATALQDLAVSLDRAGRVLNDLVGYYPTSFRAPFLLSPRFYDESIYRALAARGYVWASNREVRHPEELVRPGLFGGANIWRKAFQSSGFAARAAHSGAVRLALNPGLVVHETAIGGLQARMRWLLNGTAPYSRGGLLEVPVSVPLDCDVLGLPSPTSRTPSRAVEYAVAALLHALAGGCSSPILTFHDWIITSANRVQILDRVILGAKELGYHFVTGPSPLHSVGPR
jgi:peptidoglycan/xylan/chitin deacetylase (PgdA/CDA1 family)